LDIQKQKSSVALLSVVSNSTLVIFKLIVGLVIGSVSVISEAIHSGVDLLASIIAYIAVRTSGKPADKEHPFGHGKVENISGTVEALLIFVAAVWIIFEAVKKLMHPEPMDKPGLGIIVMLISAIANIFVSRMLFKVGKRTDSMALQADAWHLQTDVYTSAGVMLGLAIIYIGKYFAPDADLRWIDPLAAILVALLIIRAAYNLTVQSAKDLLDISLPVDEEALIRESIASSDKRIFGYHNLRTRKAGSDRFVEFHLLVSSEMTVDESHKVADLATDSIRKNLPGTHVTVHVEPCSGHCNRKCSSGCLLSESDRKKASDESHADIVN